MGVVGGGGGGGGGSDSFLIFSFLFVVTLTAVTRDHQFWGQDDIKNIASYKIK